MTEQGHIVPEGSIASSTECSQNHGSSELFQFHQLP